MLARKKPPMPLAKELLRDAVLTLQQAHIESASQDARLLLEHVLGLSREALMLSMDDPVGKAQEAYYADLIRKRAGRKPVAQLLGRREFWGREFKVTEHTLDPRPDSETLIEAILRAMPDRNQPLRILDLGTGTGCLMLTLLSEYEEARGVAVDASLEALSVAKENAMALGLTRRVEFVHSRWFDNVSGQFDVIISNPPYIPTADIAECEPEVSQHEPKLALDGGTDGLTCYREIITSMGSHMAPSGVVVFELGMGQYPAVAACAEANGFSVRSYHNDLQGVSRCIVLYKPVTNQQTDEA